MGTGRSRTKNKPFFGFPYSTENTGVIGARELSIYSEDGIHTQNDGYTPGGSYHGRHQRRDNIGGRSYGGDRSSGGGGDSGGSSRNGGSSIVGKV